MMSPLKYSFSISLHSLLFSNKPSFLLFMALTMLTARSNNIWCMDTTHHTPRHTPTPTPTSTSTHIHSPPHTHPYSSPSSLLPPPSSLSLPFFVYVPYYNTISYITKLNLILNSMVKKIWVDKNYN